MCISGQYEYELMFSSGPSSPKLQDGGVGLLGDILRARSKFALRSV